MHSSTIDHVSVLKVPSEVVIYISYLLSGATLIHFSPAVMTLSDLGPSSSVAIVGFGDN